jgi:acetyl-CoA synthetase
VGWDVIHKEHKGGQAPPNLEDYELARQEFSWEAARDELDGLPGRGGLNIAHEAVDRHAEGRQGEYIAIRWLGRRGQTRDLTYAELGEQSSRFAHGLKRLGVQPADRVCTLLGRIPELYVAALGTLKHRAVFSPLVSTLDPTALRQRLQIGRPRVLVTTPQMYEDKVVPIQHQVPSLEHVLLVGEQGADPPRGVHPWNPWMEAEEAEYHIEPTDPEAPALLHFTRGSTGQPEAVLHVHESVVMHHTTGEMVLDLHPEDIYWCTSDPGWGPGTCYGIIAPLTRGSTLVVDEAEFDVERCYDLLEREHVSVWYTAPDAVRMLMGAGTEPVEQRNLSALRFMASVGAPLDPDAVVWSTQAFGHPFHDSWWQTETGAIMIANFASTDVRPGSMGLALPGVEAAIVQRRGDGGVDLIEEPDREGELALRAGWPSMFRAYWNDPERYAASFAGGWYLTGDVVRQDGDGYFWFVGRTGDGLGTVT